METYECIFTAMLSATGFSIKIERDVLCVNVNITVACLDLFYWFTGK
jgi:hypothetical protein